MGAPDAAACSSSLPPAAGATAGGTAGTGATATAGGAEASGTDAIWAAISACCSRRISLYESFRTSRCLDADSLRAAASGLAVAAPAPVAAPAAPAAVSCVYVVVVVVVFCYEDVCK